MHDIRLYAFIGDCLTAKQNIPDLHTTIGFCCETLHQFWCETFTVIAWLTAYDYWLLLRNFAPVWCETFTVIAWLTAYDYWLLMRNLAPVLVWNFYGDCLTAYLRLLAFAAKLCTSSGVKLLRWLPDWLPTTTGFFCETFVVIVWRHTIMASWLQKKWVSKIKLRITSS